MATAVERAANRAARAIMEDLEDRSGILDGLEDDIRKEIRESISELIENQFKGAKFPTRGE